MQHDISVLDAQHDDSVAGAFSGAASSATSVVSSPVPTALTRAATGRYIAITGPINAYVTATESILVSGVDIKNETVASLEAPARRSPIAAGSTPHEHNGNGAPNSAARSMAPIPRPPTQRRMVLSDMNDFIKPAASRPINNQNAVSRNTNQILFNNSATMLLYSQNKYFLYLGTDDANLASFR